MNRQDVFDPAGNWFAAAELVDGLTTKRLYESSKELRYSYDERRQTCLLVKQLGLELCCGGIIGMGETLDDRVDFLLELQALSRRDPHRMWTENEHPLALGTSRSRPILTHRICFGTEHSSSKRSRSSGK